MGGGGTGGYDIAGGKKMSFTLVSKTTGGERG